MDGMDMISLFHLAYLAVSTGRFEAIIIVYWLAGKAQDAGPELLILRSVVYPLKPLTKTEILGPS
jgi:hypothetical protein